MDHHPATVSTTAVQKVTPITYTTRRAIATSSMTLGVWACIVFWWYPFGLMMGSTAAALAMLSIALGWRAGKEGQHLAWFGLFFGGSAAGMAVVSYRFMQLVFEGSLPPNPIPI